jgi:hypothetical protein
LQTLDEAFGGITFGFGGKIEVNIYNFKNKRMASVGIYMHLFPVMIFYLLKN